MSLLEELVALAIKVGHLQAQLEVQLVRGHWKDHEDTVPAEAPAEPPTPKGATQQRIIEYVDQHGSSTVKEIAAAIGGNPEVVRQNVGRLVKMEALIRDGRTIRRRHPA